MNIPTPDGLQLREYQKAGAAHLVRNTAALLGDEPGTGKTIQVAAALNMAHPGIPIFIGCPETLMINWLRELKTWLVTPRSIGLASAKHVPDTEIIIANYDIFPRLVPYFKQKSFAIALLDEGHRIKTPDSQRTQAAGHIVAGHRWILSGTPILNRPSEAWALLWWLLRDKAIPYGQYVQYFCNAHLRELWSKRFNKQTGKMEPYKKKVWDMSGAAHLDQLHQYLIQEAHMLRRRKMDVLTELPPKVYQVIELNEERVRKLIRNEAKAVARMGGFEDALTKLREGAAVAFEDFTDVRHELALAKVNPAIEFIEDALQEEHKVVVFAYHRDVVAGLMDELKKYNPVKVIGGMSAGDKDAAVQTFQHDTNCRVFIGNDAAGEGLTLTAATRCIFVELDPVPGAMEQKSDRLHRMGQKGTVLVQALVFAESLDVRLIWLLWSKDKIIKQAVDGL